MILEPRSVSLTTRTGTQVSRLLPQAKLRRIGAWVFADLFGPIANQEPMQVGTHPHTGLQTATWLFSGQIEHNDSVGSLQNILPGQLNLMTAGRGISHSELQLTTQENLHAIQLWIALPDEVRKQSPTFDHYDKLPRIAAADYSATIFVGEFQNHRSPAAIYSPLVGVELNIKANALFEVELDPEFEYGFISIGTAVQIDGQEIDANHLSYLSTGHEKVVIQSGDQPARLILLGGAPFAEPLIMWWNFIARTHDEIVEMRDLWQSNSAVFGEVKDSLNQRIPAPELPPITLQPK